MEEILKIKLWNYILKNNPELMISLQEENAVVDYLNKKMNSIKSLLAEIVLEGKPRYIIEETCINLLTEDLKPSRFVYISSILEEEFEPTYIQFSESGILLYEVMNLMESCKAVFGTIGFTTESEDNPVLRYAIMGQIAEYLQ
jgi:hypothetical protein